jgi:hypothetical protein
LIQIKVKVKVNVKTYERGARATGEITRDLLRKVAG